MGLCVFMLYVFRGDGSRGRETNCRYPLSIGDPSQKTSTSLDADTGFAAQAARKASRRMLRPRGNKSGDGG
jgi:hypothetical protein